MAKIKRKKVAIKKKKLKPVSLREMSRRDIKRRKFLVRKKVKKVVRKIIRKKPIRSKVINIKNIKRKINKHSAEGFSAESLFKAKIKVIGVGGGGGSIVSEIGKSLKKATFVIADTDIRALKKKSGIKYFWFGEELTHGLGTGVDVELAKQAAELAKEKISGFFKDQDIIIFVASLGGGLGSGATQVFADVAKEFGGITFGIFTMPFKFEGKNKYRIAQNALKSLRQSLNVSLVIPNEKIFKIIDTSTPITNAFSTVNKSLIGSLESLIDLIYNPGVINIDFADLRTILRGRGNSAFLNTIEESGKDRVEKTCANIFKNPLLQNSNFKQEKILFNIAGSESLSMFEVEKISSHIANLNPKAKIIFGISKDSKLKNKIKTTILMTGGAAKEEVLEVFPVEKIKPIKPSEIVSKEPVKFHAEKKEKPTISKAKRKISKPKIKIKKLPVLEQPLDIPIIEQNKLNVVQAVSLLNKKTIRRSGLEIKEAEEEEEKNRIAQEKEWEIPAFLRKVKFKS